MKQSKHDIYRVPLREIIAIVMVLCLAMLSISYLFFDSLLGLLGLMVPFWILLRECIEERREKRRMKAVMEFKDFLECLSGNLYAGLSLENSFINAFEQAKRMFHENFVMETVLLGCVEKIQNHVPMEEVLLQLADVTQLDEVWDFASLAMAAKRNGGNLIKIIRQANEHIGERLRLEQEIATLISAKRMEQRIMCVMPFIMVAYMKLTSPGYFSVLYHNVPGVLFMGVCVGVIFIAYEVGAKIIKMAL